MNEESKKDAGSIVVTTPTGKTIEIRRPHVLAQYRLVEALGDTAANRVYLMMVIPVLWIKSINDVEVVMPSTKREVESLISRLDEDGLSSVSKAIEEHFQSKDTTESAKK